jgi:hypothetical protein
VLIIKNWLPALGVVSFSVLLRWALPQAGATNVASLALILLLAFLAIAWAAGVGWKDLQEEKEFFKQCFERKRIAADVRFLASNAVEAMVLTF